MIFATLLRLLCGYVQFNASGGFAERFINLCSLNGIPLWKLGCNKECITACTSINGYLNIKKCAVCSGMKLKIISRHGLPFFLNKYRRRSGILIGFMLFLAIIGVMSSMVWTINISGNQRTTNEEILSVLSQAGLKPGVFSSSVNASEIRFFALSRLENVTYLTVNLMGSAVQVEITESMPKPQLISSEAPCDVVSTADGQIAVLEVYEGTKMYKTGEAVRKGDVLAGGFVELTDGSVRLRHAEAYALITTQINLSVQSDKTKKLSVLTEQKSHTTLHLFGLDIPLFIASQEAPSAIRNHSLNIGGICLPIGYTKEIFNSYSAQKANIKSNRLALSTAEDYFLKKNEFASGAQVVKENVTVDGNGISAEYMLTISAAASREMLFE